MKRLILIATLIGAQTCIYGAEVTTKKVSESSNLERENGKKLWTAAKNADLDRVLELMRQGADPLTTYQAEGAPMRSGTVLHVAVLSGNAAFVRKLLEQDQKFRTMINSTEPSWARLSPLQVAIIHGYADVAKVLLDNGADINYKNNLGQTPLSIAQEEVHRKDEPVVYLMPREGTIDREGTFQLIHERLQARKNR